MIEINNRTKTKINQKMIVRVVNKFFAHYKIKNKEISIAIVGDRTIKNLNRLYRASDQPTDILSFAGEGDFFGELIVDYAQIKRQAAKYSSSASQEMIFILVHGLLHLSGYDDKTKKDREKMIKMGENFLNSNIM